MSKEIYLPKLVKLFRQFGYEGVSLSKVSQETGLGKASLYHYFPGGKAQMAEGALIELDRWLRDRILPILTAASSGCAEPIDAFTAMCEEVNEFFDGGRQACLWAILVQGQPSADLFYDRVNSALVTWIEAIAKVLVVAGLDWGEAKQRGEDALIAIQGALILCKGLDDFKLFARTMEQLPKQLCRDLDED